MVPPPKNDGQAGAMSRESRNQEEAVHVVDEKNEKYFDNCGEDFHLAMMLFVTSADRSTGQYEALTTINPSVASVPTQIYRNLTGMVSQKPRSHEFESANG